MKIVLENINKYTDYFDISGNISIDTYPRGWVYEGDGAYGFENFIRTDISDSLIRIISTNYSYCKTKNNVFFSI